jgi:hypothetical protein
MEGCGGECFSGRCEAGFGVAGGGVFSAGIWSLVAADLGRACSSGGLVGVEEVSILFGTSFRRFFTLPT